MAIYTRKFIFYLFIFRIIVLGKIEILYKDFIQNKKTSLKTPITHLHFNSSWMANENGISRTARMGATMRSSVSTRRTSKRGTMKVAQ